MTTTTGAGGGASTTAAKSTGTTAKAGSSATTAAGGPATTAAASGGGGSTSTVGAKPGTYTYKASGTSTSGTPPTTKQQSGSSTLKVDPATGTDQHSTETSDQAGTSESTYRFASNGVLIVDLKMSGQANAEFKPDPPVLGLPHPWTNGQQWSWDMKSTDGNTTIHGDFKITGTESVTVGGTSVDCVKFDYTLNVKTSFQGAPVTVTITGTRWQSEKYSLLIKDHSVTDAGAFGKFDFTKTLDSVNPS